ncbi:MAG: HNH endonuclease, partial [Candidatus Dormiibacterota bacterium]
MERFWKYVDAPEDFDVTKCWNWAGSVNTAGYGQIGDHFAPQGLTYKVWSAHRLSYMIAFGELPPGEYVLDHACKNRLCVNPFHLNPTTTRDNATKDQL